MGSRTRKNTSCSPALLRYRQLDDEPRTLEHMHVLGLEHYEGRKRGEKSLSFATYLKFNTVRTFTHSVCMVCSWFSMSEPKWGTLRRAQDRASAASRNDVWVRSLRPPTDYV
jgi:hypothetical protein